MQEGFIKKVDEVIERNIENENFGVSELASKLGMSRSSLHRKIKTKTKLTASQYLSQFRLKYAFEILKQTELTVSEVAFNVGFSSPSYFVKCFHDFYGYSPGEVSKKLENGDYDSNTSDERYIKKRKKIVLLSAAILLTVLIVLLIIINPFSPKIESYKLAILPFTYHSTDEEIRIINGIRVELFTKLRGIEKLELLSKLTSDTYFEVDKKASEIGKESKATHVLSGEGMNENGKYILRLYLTDTKKDKDIWQESYPLDLDYQEIVAKISTQILEELDVEITQEEKLKFKLPKTNNPYALQYFNMGVSTLEMLGLNAKCSGPEYIKAFDNFRNAIKEDSTFADAYVKLAHFYINRSSNKEKQKDRDTTKFLLDKALYHNPKLPSAHDYYSIYLYHMGKPEEAEKEFKKYIELSREEGMEKYEEYMKYFWYYRRLGEKCKAIESYLNYIKFLPEGELIRGGSVYDFMNFLSNNGFPQVAQKYLNELYRQNNNFEGYNYRANMFNWANGRLDSVIKVAERALSKDSTSQGYTYEMIIAYMQKRNYEKAAFYISKLRQIVQDSTFEDKIVGFYYIKTGREEIGKNIVNEAIENLKHWLNTGSNNSLNKLFIAECYAMVGEKELALKYLNELYEEKQFAVGQYKLLKESVFYDNIREELEFQKVVKYIEDIYLPKHQCVEEVLRKYGEID